MKNLSADLSDFIIFEHTKSSSMFAISKKKWQEKYRYNTRRLNLDKSFIVEAELISYDYLKNEYVKATQSEPVFYYDLKAVLVKKYEN